MQSALLGGNTKSIAKRGYKYTEGVGACTNHRQKCVEATIHAAHYHKNVNGLKNKNVKGSLEKVVNFSERV